MRLAAVLMVLFVSSSARAGELLWQAPGEAGCPDAASFAARVAAVPLGDLDVRARVTGEDETWHVSVRVRAGETVLSRELDAASCDEAAGAAALVIGLLAEDLAAPPAPPPPPRVRLDAQTTRDVEPAPRRFRLALDGLLRGGLGWGVQPDAAPLLGAALAVGFADVRLAAGLDYWPAQSQRVATGAGADVSLWTTTWRACWSPAWLSACAGVDLGELRARGFGAPFVDTGRRSWTAAVVAFGARYKPLDRLVFALGAEVVRPFERAVFVVEGERLFVVEPWSARLVLAVETTIL